MTLISKNGKFKANRQSKAPLSFLWSRPCKIQEITKLSSYCIIHLFLSQAGICQTSKSDAPNLKWKHQELTYQLQMRAKFERLAGAGLRWRGIWCLVSQLSNSQACTLTVMFAKARPKSKICKISEKSRMLLPLQIFIFDIWCSRIRKAVACIFSLFRKP